MASGEANVFQENLDSFLAIAEELQLKGLMGKAGEEVGDFDETPPPPTFSSATNTDPKITSNYSKRQIPTSKIHDLAENRTLAIPPNFSGDLDEINERVDSMLEKSRNKSVNGSQLIAGKAYGICKVCGKEGRSRDIKDHIEANHLKGIIIPCNLCDKTFRSRNSFRPHKRQHLQQIDLDIVNPF